MADPARPDATATEAGAAMADDDTAAVRTAELEERVAFLEDQWRRALADLDNVRKRTTRELVQARTDERTQVAAQWLHVLDNLDRALEHAGDLERPGGGQHPLLEGVRAVRDQAVALLASLGFPRQEPEMGERFDPRRHEAVATTPRNDVPEGTVVGVVLPGYGEDERQLRPAAVVVATAADDGTAGGMSRPKDAG
ncbi:nucleotide exchange factor GrpE [Actinopolymorpha sp. B9G3]|uniref:nucleotide exchange factor GrpE n=1 Tax=Actinopolymorpha sp. B9G3 TaxID=3158970 RepID=UPI0032D8D39B